MPSEVVTLQGGTGYNNFDTASDFYSYSPDAAADVPAVVTGHYGAGRCNHGDFQYTFDNATEDANYDVILDLSNKLEAYASSLVKIYCLDEYSDEQPGGDELTPEPGGDDPDPQSQDSVVIVTFNGSSSNAMFTAAENYGDGKITYDGTYYKKGEKLDSKGSVVFTPQKDYNMVLVLATVKPGRDVKINGEKTTVSGAENAEGAYSELLPISVTADTEYKITKGSAEAILMLIKLTPKE